MNHENEPGRRDSENRGGPVSGSFVWYLVAIGVAFFVLTLYLVHSRRLDMSFSDLESLIEKSRRDAQGKLVLGRDGYHDVVDDVDEPKEIVRYSNLQDVVIGDDEITARVDRKIIMLDGKRVDPIDAKYALKNDVKIG